MDYKAVRRAVIKSGMAGYRWVGDHTDELDEWCEKAIDRSRGKAYEKVVVTPAELIKTAVAWVDEHHDGGSSEAKSR